MKELKNGSFLIIFLEKPNLYKKGAYRERNDL
jgi:hypothetical protein